MNRFQVAGTVRTHQIGRLRVSYVPDGLVKMVPGFLFPATTPEDWVAGARFLDADGWLTVSSGGLLVEHERRAILLESGYGPHPEPVSSPEHGMALMYGGAFVDNLRELGRRPDQIEAVAISHLHLEHFGWAAQPQFAHAEVLLSEAEWAARDAGFGVTQQVVAALEPRFRAITAGEEIFPGVTALALPGHTAGQTGFVLDGGDGTRLLVFADVMHSPIQVTHPGWHLVGEPDPQRSEQTRREILRQLKDESTIGFGIHFADAQFGRPRETPDGLIWEPLP
ncbi:MBL fold hydrolase [Actinoplanes sp. NBRC 14428]|nr:MBL fold hydrolase [Actinoplanes sp. NBRC 14428]